MTDEVKASARTKLIERLVTDYGMTARGAAVAITDVRLRMAESPYLGIVHAAKCDTGVSMGEVMRQDGIPAFVRSLNDGFRPLVRAINKAAASAPVYRFENGKRVRVDRQAKAEE